MYAWLLILFLAALLSLWFWKNRRLIAFSWKTDGPFALLPFGCIFYYPILLNPKDALKNIMAVSKAHKNRFKFWLGPIFILVLRDPEEIKCFFASKLSATKSFVFNNWMEIMGLGIVTASGKLWTSHRRIANPLVHNVQSLKKYQEIFVRHSIIMAENLEIFCQKNEPVDVLIHASRFTGDILAEAIFKVKPHFYSGKYDHYIHAVDDVAETSFQRMIQIWLYPRIFFNLSKCGKKANNAIVETRKYAISIIEEIQEKCEAGQGDEEPGMVEQMLRSLKEKNGVESMEEIIHEIRNMFPAGMDTSGTIAAFLILMLAMHKRCQDNLWNELKEFYAGDFNRDVEYDDFSSLPYLDWCFKEVCRLFPVGYITLRDIDDDLHIKTDHSDYVIPHGATVMVSNIMLQKDERYWDQPELFMPERFSDEVSVDRHPQTYLPFGGGARMCLGFKFGTISLKTLMVYILRRYELHSDWKLEDIPLKCDISIRSCWGYNVLFTKRKY